MTDMIELPEHAQQSAADALWHMAGLPEWLEAAVQPEIVAAALARSVPEFASGTLTLRGCKVKRMRLKDTSGRWGGSYALTVADPQSGDTQVVPVRGTLSAPGIPPVEAGPHDASPAFGSAAWSCDVPELGMQFEREPPDTVLAAMPILTDAEQARALLEQGIRAGSPAYADMRIARCTPQVLSYKPGSRGAIRYDLEYPDDLAANRHWPATVIVKTYRGSKGQVAYDGMRALWDSPLAASDDVAIAEPLAYLPDLKVLVQAPVPGDRILEDVLTAALNENTPAALDELGYFIRKAAAGLAAIHRSGARHGDVVTWAERVPDLRKIADRLAVPLPELAAAVTALLSQFEALDAAHPADPPVPTHGTFKPEQVLIHDQQIGVIDFDGFCMAEPALDVAVFLASIKDVGLNTGDDTLGSAARRERLALLNDIGETFMVEYMTHAPLARERVALWEALEYLNDVLDCWIKVKPAEVATTMLILEQHLRSMGVA